MAGRHSTPLSRSIAALLMMALLSACAGPSVRSDKAVAGQLATTDRAVYLDLIRKMLDQQQYYAALAHIQQQQAAGQNNDDLRYLEAEARRQLGQFTAADTLYRSLLRSPRAVDAYHGLGLLYAPRNLGAAIANLREATRRAPADASARNDLGYALLQARRFSEARLELATAVELDPGSEKARNNLLLLLMVLRDEATVQRLIQQSAVPADTVARLRRDALALRSPPPAAAPSSSSPSPKQPAPAAGVKKS